jgi:hypothetical protein
MFFLEKGKVFISYLQQTGYIADCTLWTVGGLIKEFLD